VRRRLAALSVVPLLLLGTAACGDDGGTSSGDSPQTATAEPGDPIAGVEVTGAFGEEPTVKVDEPLEIDETQTRVVTPGDGNPVVEGEQALLNLYLVNGTTGEKAASTFDQGAPFQVRQVTEGQLWPGVLDAIVDQPVGSRLTVAAAPKDAYGAAGNPQLGIGADDPVLFVVDIVSVEPTEVLDGPEGEPATDVPDDLPTVVEEDGNVTEVTFENAPKKPSDKLQVIPLIEGDGPPARKGSLVTFDYFGQVYGTDTVFDESYSKEPVTFPLGIGGLIRGWDEALVGVNRGSRLMIIAPPDYGYGEGGNPQAGIKGTDTLVFVVDILGVDEPA